MIPWNKIKDKKPKEDGLYLVLCKLEDIPLATWYDVFFKEFRFYNTCALCYEPFTIKQMGITHWVKADEIINWLG